MSITDHGSRPVKFDLMPRTKPLAEEQTERLNHQLQADERFSATKVVRDGQELYVFGLPQSADHVFDVLELSHIISDVLGLNRGTRVPAKHLLNTFAGN